ncbi:MAG: hypothetical protein N2037_11965 [Acidimicrobiales bacterium]|nr:hypothetical protein [Acidimicrobiales bacterium]
MAPTNAPGTPAPSTAEATENPPLLPPGTAVEVRTTLDSRWSRGFEVVSASRAGYRLRRLSDGSELPGRFPIDQVRKERKRSTWWY